MHSAGASRGAKGCLRISAIGPKPGSMKLAPTTRGPLTLAVLSALLLIAVQSAWAQTLTTLYNFTGGADGGTPYSTLVLDKAGNLYGTTSAGGASGCGTVFEVAPNGAETTLYSFAGGTDGCNPWAGLVFDKKGNLYGTTQYGGNTAGCGGPACGTVYELTPSGGGWTEQVLYSFEGFLDPGIPTGNLILDKKGNLYGTTTSCEDGNACGSVFELKHSKGGWTEAVLFAFGCGDGCVPWAGLIFDAKGNLYGTTFSGEGGYGVAFELTPSGGGWTQTILQQGLQAFSTYAGLVFDKNGNLYGTTGSPGIVFELTPSEGGWTETILHNFAGYPNDGADPFADLVFDSKGNLYSTTFGGGTSDNGTVFELTPSEGGWTETILHNFAVSDGAAPWAAVVIGKKGILYGTTALGGSYDAGTVFALNPKKKK